MQHVLTLTSDPAHRALSAAHADMARDALRAAGAEPRETRWLGEGCAVDILIDGPAFPDLRAAVREALGGVAADVNLQAEPGRRKRLLIADMDSTIITGESLDELADFIGIKDKVAPITARAMRGEIDFETALRDRVKLLAGQPASLLDRLLAERITLMPGAGTLVRTMAAAGCFTALVSGGFTVVTGAVAARVGFHTHRGNVLEVRDGVLLGTVADPILGKEAKLESLLAFCADQGLSPEETMAVGDGANDIPMLERAGTGVAFRAKPAVAAAARFSVEHGDLTVLLYLQGIKETEFAPA